MDWYFEEGDGRVEKARPVVTLGSVFCSVSVQASLDEAGVTRAELLQFHRRNEDAEAKLDRPDWKCSPFVLPRSGQVVWAITDPEQQTTLLLLEGP